MVLMLKLLDDAHKVLINTKNVNYYMPISDEVLGEQFEGTIIVFNNGNELKVKESAFDICEIINIESHDRVYRVDSL